MPKHEGMRKIGNWAGVRALTNGLGREMTIARDQALKQIGLKAEGAAKTHISKQDLNWVPLKPSTIAANIRAKQSTKILIATSTYFQSITSWVTKQTALAGIKRTVKSKDGSLLANIAKIMEFGSKVRNIPARKLWTPVFKEVREWLRETRLPERILKKRLSKFGV